MAPIVSIVHLVITDSGLGGLAVCAGVERALSRAGSTSRITYVNAWPEEGRGYNSLPDVPARARVLDRAMSGIDALQPSLVLIACNTLSILYEHTAHRTRAATPVQGIVDAGVGLFEQTLRAAPAATLVLLGTRTTIESGVHRARLLERGIAPERVTGASCHGLATAIETDVHAGATAAAIDACADGAAACAVASPGEPIHLGLCCTHYGWVGERLREAVARRVHRPVGVLDPNGRLVGEVVPRLVAPPGAEPSSGPVPVRVLSKVRLDAVQRENVAALIEAESPATADALRSYQHVPDLF
jgi:glutamate racemase